MLVLFFKISVSELFLANGIFAGCSVSVIITALSLALNVLSFKFCDVAVKQNKKHAIIKKDDLSKDILIQLKIIYVSKMYFGCFPKIKLYIISFTDCIAYIQNSKFSLKV